MTLPEIVDEASTRLELGPSPLQEWFECAKCVESILPQRNSDREGWAREHAKSNPGHTRFRTVRQQEYRVVPDTP
ncbi:hypothetical protein ACIBAC_28320 [Streptomyces sp. NPDC051362]|uniref:DUF7848 domain-containing protein n=1 Tax=Streptomyces sp. NPDC051362 TaxID=3365651 RepID=UPI0037BD3AD1